jgi:hypothetical protein
MTIRKLFPLLFVAVAAAVLMPETASAQCWSCGKCHWESHDSPLPRSCHGAIIMEPVLGYINCDEPAPCECHIWLKDLGMCGIWANAAAETEEMKKTLAAIKAGRSLSADGPFVYLRQGADYVVRRRCDAAEVGRVAVVDVQPVPIVGAG